MLEFFIIVTASANFSTIKIFKPIWLKQRTTFSSSLNGIWSQLIWIDPTYCFWFFLVLFGLLCVLF